MIGDLWYLVTESARGMWAAPGGPLLVLILVLVTGMVIGDWMAERDARGARTLADRRTGRRRGRDIGQGGHRRATAAPPGPRLLK